MRPTVLLAIGAVGLSGGYNSCDPSNLPSLHLLDVETGRPLKSISEGLFVFPHGLRGRSSWEFTHR